MTLPLRLMILHFSHMGFTDGLTFMLQTSCKPDGPAAAEARPRDPATVVDGLLDPLTGHLLLQVIRPLVTS